LFLPFPLDKGKKKKRQRERNPSHTHQKEKKKLFQETSNVGDHQYISTLSKIVACIIYVYMKRGHQAI
jgi:hypothetical protein